MPDAKAINDLIYFDLPKATALLTQLDGSLELAANPQKVFDQLERRLLEAGAAVDVSAVQGAAAPELKSIHDKVKAVSYLRAEGWATIEDYERFKSIADHSNAMIEFIGRCTIHSVEQSEDYRKAQQELDNVRAVAKKETDRNKRATLEQRIKAMEQRFRQQVAEKTQMEGLPDFMVDGFGLFIDSFLHGRIGLRVFPHETLPEFHVLANLKKECFVDSSFENVLAAYGAKPNVKMSVLGLVTSIPEQSGPVFDPMSLYKAAAEKKEDAKMEHAFRQFFNALDVLEGLVRFSRYPNVTVYPLAVYRRITLNK